MSGPEYDPVKYEGDVADAHLAVRCFERAQNGVESTDEPWRERISDLVTNLRFLADEHDVEWAEVEHAVERDYEYERRRG